MSTSNIVIFASGSGTNAENIIKYFKNSLIANVKLVLCNNENAGVIKRTEKLQIPVYIFNREMLKNGQVLSVLQEHGTDFIVLAGFLWLMPKDIVRKYTGKIINIHPALLPKYGGKGMYGMHVHEAVVKNKDSESGITVHFVNEEYDKGDIIFQARCKVLETDTPEDVANKVHKLEYENFPAIIEAVLKDS